MDPVPHELLCFGDYPRVAMLRGCEISSQIFASIELNSVSIRPDLRGYIAGISCPLERPQSDQSNFEQAPSDCPNDHPNDLYLTLLA